MPNPKWRVTACSDFPDLGSWKHRRDTLIRLRAQMDEHMGLYCTDLHPEVNIRRAGAAELQQLVIVFHAVSADTERRAKERLEYWVRRSVSASRLGQLKLVDVKAEGRFEPPAEIHLTNKL